MASENAIALRDGPSQRGTALRKIALDEGPDAKPIQEQLRNAITEQAVRVIELFREWDENGDGQVSKKEFRKAMPLLGLEVPTVEVDKLFDAWDPDKSGSLELSELNKILRRGGTIELSDDLKPGAAGEIVLESKAKFALRKGKLQNAGSRVLAAVKLQAGSTKPLDEQLREALAKNAVRVIDLFKEWDADGDGTVSKAEFRRAMPMLGVEVAPEVIDTLFDRFDPDKSGSIEMGEISKMMRRTDTGYVAGPHVEVQTSASTKIAIRKGLDDDSISPLGQWLLSEMDANNDGEISRAELAASLETTTFVEIELFRELDADQSGAVSKREFRKGMKTLGLEVPKEDVNKLFDSWDPDGSGSLEFQELNKILKRGGGRMEKKRKTDAITQARAPRRRRASGSRGRVGSKRRVTRCANRACQSRIRIRD